MLSAVGWCGGVILAVYVTGLSPSAFAREVVDATGVRVEVVPHPARVVTLAPSLGELAADLCTEKIDRIVGVSEFTDYPPALLKVKQIGPYNHFNLETVLALKPDLILATMDGNAKDQVEHLRELKLPVIIVGSSSFSEIRESMRTVAEALDEQTAGAKLLAAFDAGLAKIHARAKGRKPTHVLLQLGEDPLIVVGHKAFLNDALEAIGAVNVYGDLQEHYPRPAMEDVISRAPQMIVVLALGSDTKLFTEMAGRWARYRRFKIGEEGAVKVIHADPLLRPSLRLLEGLGVLERAVYGAARP